MNALNCEQIDKTKKIKTTPNNTVWKTSCVVACATVMIICVDSIHTISIIECSGDVFHFKGGWWEFTLLSGQRFRAMGKAAARGQTLLRSPVSFYPLTVVPFPFRVCSFSVVAGFGAAVILFIAWIWTL